jgi:hypothetical protein
LGQRDVDEVIWEQGLGILVWWAILWLFLATTLGQNSWAFSELWGRSPGTHSKTGIQESMEGPTAAALSWGLLGHVAHASSCLTYSLHSTSEGCKTLQSPGLCFLFRSPSCTSGTACHLGRHSTTCATPPALFAFLIFEIGACFVPRPDWTTILLFTLPT